MATQTYLEFEKPLADLERKIQELQELSGDTMDLKAEIAKLERKAEKVQDPPPPPLDPKKPMPSSSNCWCPATSTARLPWTT